MRWQIRQEFLSARQTKSQSCTVIIQLCQLSYLKHRFQSFCRSVHSLEPLFKCNKYVLLPHFWHSVKAAKYIKRQSCINKWRHHLDRLSRPPSTRHNCRASVPWAYLAAGLKYQGLALAPFVPGWHTMSAQWWEPTFLFWIRFVFQAAIC